MPCAQRELGDDLGGGAFAVRAGHVDRGVGELRVGQVGRQRQDAREVGHHAPFLARVEFGERFGEVHVGAQASATGASSV